MSQQRISWGRVINLPPQRLHHMQIELEDKTIAGLIKGCKRNGLDIYILLVRAIERQNNSDTWRSSNRVLWIVNDATKPVIPVTTDDNVVFLEYRAESGYENGFIFPDGLNEINYSQVEETEG